MKLTFSPRRFVVAYDYGMGALWAPMIADSREAISERYPELDVFDRKPDHITEAFWEWILGRPEISLDGPPGALLRAALEGRTLRAAQPGEAK